MPSTKLIAVVAVMMVATVAAASVVIVGGFADFEYTCDDDGNIVVRNTSAGLFTEASWDVRDYYGMELFSKSQTNEISWNDKEDTPGLHVFKVTLKAIK